MGFSRNHLLTYRLSAPHSKKMLSLFSLGFTCFLSANLSAAVLLVPGLGPPGPLEREAVTKRPEMNNADDGEAVPCCGNEENSPTKAGGTDGFIGFHPGREAAGFYP